MLSALGASAQTAITFDDNRGSFSVIPGTMTVSGKAIPYFVEWNDEDYTETFTITDVDFKPIRTFTPNHKTYLPDSWIERSTPFVPTSAEVYEDEIRIYRQDTDVSAITTPEQLAELLGYSTAFYDYKGRISCSRYSDGFFYPDVFGYKYPTDWYYIENGTLFYAYAYAYSCYTIKVPDNLEYSKEGFYSDYKEYIEDIDDFANFDNCTYADDGDIELSQTLFNDDDKMEYIETEHQHTRVWHEEMSYSSDKLVFEDGKFIARRNGYSDSRNVAYHVKNEDGQTIMSFRPVHENCTYYIFEGDAFVFNGHLYLEFEEQVEDGVNDYGNTKYKYFTTLYRIDKEYGTAEMVKTVKSNGRFASAQDGMVNVSIDAADSDSDVILTNAAGQVVGHDHIGQGQTSAALRTGRLQHGVYNVSLRRDGRTIKNEKLMIK